MRESISQQPPRKRPCIRSSGTACASPSRAGGADQPTASTADEPVSDLEQAEQQIPTQEDRLIETEEDAMGLFRRYTALPSTDPDQYLTIHHVSDAPTFIKNTDSQYNPLTVFGPQAIQSVESPTSATTSSFTPFLNHSVSKLMNWFYQSSTKTLADLNSLAHDVILHPDFHPSDLKNFSATRESRRLEKSSLPDSDLPYLKNDDWKEAVIKVPLPLVRTRYHNEDDAHTLEVKFVHRRLYEVIKSGIQDVASSRNFHWHGFKQFWRPSDSEPEQRVYGEVYTSDAFLEMESRLPNIEGCTLEKAVVPLLIYSDSTHLANFGTASLWPIYIWFGNVSKYMRLRPSSFSAHHLAYLPSVSN
jgi:Plavaka transposase